MEDRGDCVTRPRLHGGQGIQGPDWIHMEGIRQAK